MYPSGQLPVWEFESAMPGVAWPAFPQPGRAAALALLQQLESTQWLPQERLRELQLRQIEALLRHAWDTSPYYRERWAGRYDPARPLTPERFARLPLLPRRDLQQKYEDIKSADPPAAHGNAGETLTSGSTGAPVRALKTNLTALYWTVFTLRDHLWHARDLGAKLAVIRAHLKEGEAADWGVASQGIVATGPLATLNSGTVISKQLDWLRRHDPACLLSNASNAVELARACLIRGIRLPALREVRTVSEMLTGEGRRLIREAWGVKVTDMYSAEEIGYIALQCPEHEHYHVQSEGVFLELLDEAGAQCAPGQVGRVVVTDLHNFAMPLVRYEIGDYARAGAPCACGRGLPVIAGVAGRVRNMLVTASGDRLWPYFGAKQILEVAPILQQQFVQKDYDLIEARFVTEVPLDAGQESRLQELILSGLPAGMRLQFAYCDRIPRGAGGKYDDFICEVHSP
jgi:phenylacetate-CoA ligase